MDDKLKRKLLEYFHRSQAGLPPIVAESDRPTRRRWTQRFKRWLFTKSCSVFGKSRFVNLKWRWCRGEIRERRLEHIRLATSMTTPIKRPMNYIDLGHKLVSVEPFESPPGLLTHE